MPREAENMRIFLEMLNDRYPDCDSLTRLQVCEYMGMDWYTLTRDKKFKYKQPCGKGGAISVPKIMLAAYLAG